MGKRVTLHEELPMLVDQLPTFEIRSDNFRITLSDGQAFAVPMHVMVPALAEIGRLKRQWEGRAQIAVVPLCELCIRHNLPRDTH